MHPITISHVTLTNSLGRGTASTLEALRGRRCGLSACSFDTVDLDTWIGKVEGLDGYVMRSGMERYDCRNNRLAQLALEQDGFAAAVVAARQRYGAARIGVFMGTSTSGLLQTELAYRNRDPQSGALPVGFHYAETQNTYSLADFVRTYLDLHGPSLVVSSACSSTAKVFGNALRMMEAGVCDAAVVGGVDTLCFTTLYGFNSLGLVSTQPCRPYDAERNGISIGEGAGFALLERRDAKSSAQDLCLLGIGESSDAHHMSSPHPEGLGAQLAMKRALDAAGLTASDIDYINLHGTATKANDASEDKGVTALFKNTPCSSTKGWTGHLLGAAGITEAVIAMLAIEHGFIPGSLGTRQLDPALNCNYQIENSEAKVERVLSNSFGFGGSNCSLIIGRAA